MDVGCGTGAITAGIALAVGKNGSVVGVDRDATLLAVGRQDHVGFPNLALVEGDALDLGMESRFDVVNAARVLQWIGEPGRAIAQMKLATKPGGMVVALWSETGL